MTSMKDFIPYEQALELKELGFDEPCLGFYEFGSMDEEWHLRTKYVSKNEYNDVIHILKVPLYQQAFRWFREKYDLRIWIESNYGVLKFEYVIATTNPNFMDKQFNDFSGYKTYEEAELACLIKLIEIVKTKQQ
jgi:hypothetical protein